MPQENLIQRGDLLQRLTRSLEIKGQRSPILQLDNIVAPVVILEDTTKQSEFISPKDRVGMVALTTGSLAGERSGIALVNPAGSGLVVVVEKITVSLAAAQIMAITNELESLITGTYVLNSPGYWADARHPGFTTCKQYNGTDVGLIPAVAWESQRVGSSNPYELLTTPMVIQEGRAVLCECQQVAVSFTGSFVWREIAEP